ncbi:MAG: serine O-acetyltransferase [Clostridia bacterium]|nr:serine O-acetyltransferase [Clostridia bacterium]
MAKKPIDTSFTGLADEVRDTLRWAGAQLAHRAQHVPAAKALLSAAKDIREEVRVVRERDPAATSDLEVLLLYSGLHAVLAHKISHKLYKNGHLFSARAVSQAARALTGIEIHPGATIGRGFFIDHGAGVVIGETAEIGDNCTLYQGVTLGGTGKDTGKRHPTLGNGVMVGAGAKVLGPFTIGDNAKIAAGAVVLEAIPEDCTAVGIPARVVKCKNEKVACEANRNLDHIHIPDPVSQELCRLREQIGGLRRSLHT